MINLKKINYTINLGGGNNPIKVISVKLPTVNKSFKDLIKGRINMSNSRGLMTDCVKYEYRTHAVPYHWIGDLIKSNIEVLNKCALDKMQVLNKSFMKLSHVTNESTVSIKELVDELNNLVEINNRLKPLIPFWVYHNCKRFQK